MRHIPRTRNIPSGCFGSPPSARYSLETVILMLLGMCVWLVVNSGPKSCFGWFVDFSSWSAPKRCKDLSLRGDNKNYNNTAVWWAWCWLNLEFENVRERKNKTWLRLSALEPINNALLLLLRWRMATRFAPQQAMREAHGCLGIVMNAKKLSRRCSHTCAKLNERCSWFEYSLKKISRKILSEPVLASNEELIFAHQWLTYVFELIYMMIMVLWMFCILDSILNIVQTSARDDEITHCRLSIWHARAVLHLVLCVTFATLLFSSKNRSSKNSLKKLWPHWLCPKIFHSNQNVLTSSFWRKFANG